MDPGKARVRSTHGLLPRHDFDACVRRYGGDRRPRGFSCRDQFLCLAFAQLTFRESLRDIETCLRSFRTQALPCGLSRQGLAEHIGRRQPRPRLAASSPISLKC